MLAPRGEASNKWYHRPSLYSPCDGVNTAAPYQTYRHIAEALFYLLLWCVSSGVSDGMSGWTGQTMEWIECGYVELHPLLRVLKHRKEREAFMWDPAEMFAKIDAQFVPLAGWVWPLWRLLSDAHFWCRFCPKEKKNRHLDSVLTFNKIVKIIRGNGDFDLRIGTLLPLPCEDSDEL
ncbi:hypothetical protein B0H19DRAFT_1032286 [Mycena capillaripes]|nr:hypothetical protein B0H19DRAFT_1032286 [Mycena capillaripes]